MDAIPRKQLLWTFAIYTGLIGLACAQPPGPPRGGRGGPPGGGMGMLLRSEEVRAELEILDEQNEQLRELEQEIRGEMRELFRGRRGGQRGEGERGSREEMRAKFEELREKAEGRLAEVLSTQQLERLKQINAQVQIDRGGARALMGGPLAEQLDLSEEQREQLREKSREIQDELQKKIQAARAEARDQLMQVLTSEQRAKLEQLTGEPFTMTWNDRGRGRGGRERGGPGGRRGGRPGPPPPPPEDEL